MLGTSGAAQLQEHLSSHCPNTLRSLQQTWLTPGELAQCQQNKKDHTGRIHHCIAHKILELQIHRCANRSKMLIWNNGVLYKDDIKMAPDRFGASRCWRRPETLTVCGV